LEYKEKMILKNDNDELYPMSIETSEFAKYGVGL